MKGIDQKMDEFNKGSLLNSFTKFYHKKIHTIMSDMN